MRVRAFAKINLSLRVLGTRPDGYHELRTTFQSIALHDTLVIRRSRGPFTLACDDEAVPVDETNLITRAARVVWRAAGRRGVPRDIVIELAKRIPIAAGLGGGSSDAAAALRALARLWRVPDDRLPALAASMGADAPYFFEGGTVLGLERGDLLFPLIDHPSAWVLLVVPDFGVSTVDAYRWYDARPRSSFDRLRTSGKPPSLTLSSSKGEQANDLEPAVTRHHPEVGRMVTALWRAGAFHAAMSGSGSAVFGLFETRAAALRASTTVHTSKRRTIVTHTVSRGRYRALAGLAAR